MTLRAKPVVRGPGRSGWNSGDRRTTLLNLGFVVAITVSILILVGYAAWSWYDDHFGAAATVNGEVITKDQLRTRYVIENFRIDYTAQRIRTLANAGRISEATETSQLQFLEQRRQSLAGLTLERLIDVNIQAKLATEEGVSVTDADIDAQLITEATTNEQRHTFVIEVQPQDDLVTGEPGDAEKANAKAKAEKALADLKSGKPWDDIAKTISTATSASQNGDLGWLPLESGYDEPFMTAIYALQPNEMTGVIEGDDGIFRIGRMTESAPASLDDTFTFQIEDKGIKLADYREAVRGDLVRKKLDEKVVADLSKPSQQRHVLQIFLAQAEAAAGSVKVRHILYAPKDDPSGAKDVPETDPAWAKAEEEAKAAYEKIKADPTLFDSIARAESDEGSAPTTGGKLPYFDPSSAIDPEFGKAIFQANLKPGDLLPPFKTAFGWHVVQFMRTSAEGEEAWLKTVRDEALGGADFAQLATDEGEGDEAREGGDIGWVAVGELAADKEDPIFKTSVGGISEVVKILNDGVYLWKVVAEEEREPTKDQIAIFKDKGFDDWYTKKKAEAVITRNGTTTATS